MPKKPTTTQQRATHTVRARRAASPLRRRRTITLPHSLITPDWTHCLTNRTRQLGDGGVFDNFFQQAGGACNSSLPQEFVDRLGLRSRDSGCSTEQQSSARSRAPDLQHMYRSQERTAERPPQQSLTSRVQDSAHDTTGTQRRDQTSRGQAAFDFATHRHEQYIRTTVTRIQMVKGPENEWQEQRCTPFPFLYIAAVSYFPFLL